MELVTQDFRFTENLLAHGEFIVDCLTMYPSGRLIDAQMQHSLSSGTCVLSFTCPPDVAVILKLKYGKYLEARKEVPDLNVIFKMLKKREASKPHNFVFSWDKNIKF
jgi:hypothetical protein